MSNMGFVVSGISCSCSRLLHSRIPHIPTASSQCSFQPPLPFDPMRNASRKKRAMLQKESLEDSKNSCRRGGVWMGLGMASFLAMRAQAKEEKTELMALDQMKEIQLIQDPSSPNAFFPLSNGAVFLVSVVLAALHASLYALVKKEKARADATIESMNVELKEKEASVASMEKKFEVELSKEKKIREKTIATANIQHQILVDHLKLADAAITRRREDWQKERRSVEELNIRVDKAEDEKRKLQEQLKESSKKYDAMLKEYNHFKSSMENISALDTKVMAGQEERIQRLEVKLKLSRDTMSKNERKLSDLIWENDNLKAMMNAQFKNVEDLKQDLEVNQDDLEKSRDEASCLAELLQVMSQELSAGVCKCDSLEEELIEARGKAESAALALKEEKGVVSILSQELLSLNAHFSLEEDLRRTIESDLEVATTSLDEMKQNALLIARQLELATSKISSLEEDKEVLYKYYDEQKLAAQEAREKLEDANKLVMRLKEEKESLEMKGKKLEEELASAKGEVLQLRSQISSSETPADDDHQHEVEDGDEDF